MVDVDVITEEVAPAMRKSSPVFVPQHRATIVRIRCSKEKYIITISYVLKAADEVQDQLLLLEAASECELRAMIGAGQGVRLLSRAMQSENLTR
jgi:hypothetical protein